MDKLLLLGAEAVAVGAIDAGISGVYAYPGTPSTEITEFIQKSKEAQSRNIRSKWAANEKTAYEAALGMSFAGKRSIVCMKHVGLNVCADPFMNSAITGVNGGLILVVADDPSMHSSQDEQDSRAYGRFAMLPVFEPATQQEAYNAVSFAFDLSESVKLPVVMRITTRMSHSRAVIERKPMREMNSFNPDLNTRQWILLPAIAKKNYAGLIDKQAAIEKSSAESPFNKVVEGKGKKAVIAFGIGYNYVMEVCKNNGLELPVLKISQYPLPKSLVQPFIDRYDDILIVEEGYPIYEELLRGFSDNKKFRGRMDGALPRMGELSPDAVAPALGVKPTVGQPIPDIMVNRPPALCVGCSHRDLYEELNSVLSAYPGKAVFGDIGCYTLGALPPYSAINSCVDMGASITMAKGAAEAGLHPAVAVIGDSTFTHSGMTGLLDCVNDNAQVTIIISDNSTTAMTGGQDSAGTNKLVDICKGLGVEPEHIVTIVPVKPRLEQNIELIKKEIEYKGVSVILAQRECMQTLARKKKAAKK
ncbi:MAG: indolepyruvate ferredoxin oxidoreductase [Salinivirgaceae bacterium]|nr:indolepyruvate ferredoxin oxidoreductase [Salinivirgaceae bacterium]